MRRGKGGQEEPVGSKRHPPPLVGEPAARRDRLGFCRLSGKGRSPPTSPRTWTPWRREVRRSTGEAPAERSKDPAGWRGCEGRDGRQGGGG